MDDFDLKLFGVVIGLAIVQAILMPGSLRESIEIWLILQLFPVVDFIVQWGNLMSTTEVGSIMYYMKLFVILLQDVATGWLYIRIKQRVSTKKKKRK